MKKAPIVFLLDVDNTLLDNDTAQNAYLEHICRTVSPEASRRYKAIFHECAQSMGYADYLGALQRYRMEDRHDPRLLGLSSFMLDYDFKARIYDGVTELIQRLARMGTPVLLSDGDVVFQPRKIIRSGLWDAVDGRVIITVHKELELPSVQQQFDAGHYVVVDDKLRLLTAIKAYWGERVTTVFVRQGHYAADAEALAAYPSADITLERIGDLRAYSAAQLLKAALR